MLCIRKVDLQNAIYTKSRLRECYVNEKQTQRMLCMRKVDLENVMNDNNRVNLMLNCKSSFQKNREEKEQI